MSILKRAIKSNFLSTTAVSCALFFSSAIYTTAQTKIPRSEWTGGVNVPSYITMEIYIPKKLATKPPIIVSSHACGTKVSGQVGANTKIIAAAEKNGFIIIYPENQVSEKGGSTGQNCWDVGSSKALGHDSLGDPHAVAQMVRYTLKKYNGDSSRVYAIGGSSGAMMTQALLGVYPELFTAGVPRAGVPCGCWAESYTPKDQWSGPCANGTISKTAEQWGNLVRAINPNYKGHRPRVQLFHGENDQTIKFPNFGESIKEWTNVLGLNTTPDSTAKVSKSSTIGYEYNQKFWKNKEGYIVLEAWSAPNQPHSMSYEENAILKFFGLDTYKEGDLDPEYAFYKVPTVMKPGKAIGTVANFLIRDNTLVLNGIRAEQITVSIVNTSGQMLYIGKHTLTANNSLSIPVTSLRAGFYVANLKYSSGNKQINNSSFQFVLTK